jgi:hypothetical protein
VGDIFITPGISITELGGMGLEKSFTTAQAHEVVTPNT